MEPRTMDLNEALLRGVAVSEPVRSHESHGEVFYRFPLAVARLSGTEDVLNIVAARRLLRDCPVLPGSAVEVRGEARTFNNRSGVGSRLVVTVHARELLPAEGEPANTLRLHGTICRPVVTRKTPLGREICDLLLAVNRRYGRSDYLPCIAWGALSARCGEMRVGERIALLGRLQSRAYVKQTEEGAFERVAFEVSIMSIEDPPD